MKKEYKGFDINKLLIGAEAKYPTNVLINNKKGQAYVRPLTNMEIARAKFKAEQYIKDNKGEKPEIDTNEYRKSEIAAQVIYLSAEDKDGEKYFDSVDDIRKLPVNLTDALEAHYIDCTNLTAVSGKFTDEDFEKLKNEVKKKSILLTELSQKWLMILCDSLIVELENLQKDK